MPHDTLPREQYEHSVNIDASLDVRIFALNCTKASTDVHLTKNEKDSLSIVIKKTLTAVECHDSKDGAYNFVY